MPFKAVIDRVRGGARTLDEKREVTGLLASRSRGVFAGLDQPLIRPAVLEALLGNSRRVGPITVLEL